jgi:SAM-dependent methyltransferase
MKLPQSELPDPRERNRSEDYDYRETHLAAGPSYAEFFEQSPRLRVLTAIEEAFLEKIFRAEELRRSSFCRALDFACGTGRVLAWLEKQVPDAVGVDISQSMLDVAKRRIHTAKLVCVDLTSDSDVVLGSFDVITAFRFFPNAQQSLREQVISRLASLLNDNGVIIFNNHIRKGSLNELLRSAMRGIRGMPKPVGMGRTMSDAEVIALLRAAGLREIRRFHCGVLPVAHGWLPMPQSLYAWLEKMLANARWARRFAQYHLVVCEKESCTV